MSKVTVHTQLPPGWLEAFLRESEAKYYKGIDTLPCFDGVATIGRAVVPENKEPEPLNTLIASGAPGADHVFNACVPQIEKNPQVKWWILYNEASIWTERVLNGFVAFNQQLIRRFRLKYPNKKIIVGAINTGHPKLITEDGGREMDVISLAFQGADGYAIHGYHPEHLLKDINYHVCRYRHMHNYCLSINRPHPPFFLLEFGLDAPGGPNHGHYGWRHILQDNWSAYKDMIVGLEVELQKDDYVECATLYIAEVSYGWDQFEVNESQALELAEALKNLQPPPPSTEWAEGIYLSYWQHFDEQGNEKPIDYAVLFENIDYAHIRASVGNLKDRFMEEHVAMCEEYGVPYDLWHYLTATDSGQAMTFRNAVGDHCPPMDILSDIEAKGLTPEKVKLHVGTVDSLFGVKDGIYSNLANQNLLTLLDPTGRNMWVADWGLLEIPRVPAPWEQWEWWQWQGGEDFPGIPGHALKDRFNGTVEELFAKYGGGGEINVKFYDTEGNEQSQEWAETYFGPQDAYQPDEFPVYELVRLDAYQGPEELHLLIVEVLGQNGQPLEDVEVAFGPRDVQGEVQRKFTEADGQVTFTMTDAHRFAPPDQGHYVVAVLGEHSHVYNSAGWVQGQHRWLDPVFQLRTDEPPSGIKYVWYDGSEVDEVAFRTEFGDYDIEGDSKYQVVELRAVEHDNNFRMKLLDKDGNIIYDKLAVLSWPDAQPLPECGWDGKGLVAQVKEETGDASHPMGQGAAYEVSIEGKGPHRVWWCGDSQLVGGVGWLRYTHYKHFDVTMQEVDGEPPVTEYELFTSEEPEEGGFITRNPDANIYEEGTVVNLTVIASDGWDFSYWSGDAGGTNSEVSVVMDKIKAVAAHFIKEEDEIDVPAAIVDGYAALEDLQGAQESILSGLRNLGEDV